jgi:hypothetical protein
VASVLVRRLALRGCPVGAQGASARGAKRMRRTSAHAAGRDGLAGSGLRGQGTGRGKVGRAALDGDMGGSVIGAGLRGGAQARGAPWDFEEDVARDLGEPLNRSHLPFEVCDLQGKRVTIQLTAHRGGRLLRCRTQRPTFCSNSTKGSSRELSDERPLGLELSAGISTSLVLRLGGVPSADEWPKTTRRSCRWT